jgi:hypothetical protein
LFVGAYSAAPYRFDFADFHPEKVLGFLPHELDYTHLRMIWRRWRNKADLSVFGYRMTPCGPTWIDRALSAIFRLRGDWVMDFRLIDYLVSLLGAERSPALDGSLGNGERLKKDLASLGVFDTKMSLYLLYRMREFAVAGFTGFEGRYYSLFENFVGDMARAVDLQVLITALAFKYQAQGRITHADIPDTPSIESERRQIFFGAAIGIPTFFVRRDTPNQLMRAILARTKRSRASRRYPGFVRVHNDDYRQALVQTLVEDAEDLIEMFGLREMIEDLKARLNDPANHSAAGRLLAGILSGSNRKSPMRIKAEEFNLRAESYYREELRRKHMAEAFHFLTDDLRGLELIESHFDDPVRFALDACLRGRVATDFVVGLQQRIINDLASESEIRQIINLTLLTIYHDQKVSDQKVSDQKISDQEVSERMQNEESRSAAAAPIH